MASILRLTICGLVLASASISFAQSSAPRPVGYSSLQAGADSYAVAEAVRRSAIDRQLQINEYLRARAAYSSAYRLAGPYVYPYPYVPRPSVYRRWARAGVYPWPPVSRDVLGIPYHPYVSTTVVYGRTPTGPNSYFYAPIQPQPRTPTPAPELRAPVAAEPPALEPEIIPLPAPMPEPISGPQEF